MNLRQLRISRRSVTIAAALACVVSLAIGAHAALNKRALDAAKAIATEQSDDASKRVAKVALVIGNGHYPDANAPLAQPINDARALTAALRGNGFDVDVVEDASRDDMSRAVTRLKSRIKPDSVVMLFFGGFGVQVGRESYMIPVDAAIWKESDVRRQGVSIEAVLNLMKEQGADTSAPAGAEASTAEASTAEASTTEATAAPSAPGRSPFPRWRRPPRRGSRPPGGRPGSGP